jgi:hypothetical protein
LGAELHEGASFAVKTPDVTIDGGLPDDAEDLFRTKVVFVVKLMHHLHNVVGRKARVLYVCHLVAVAIFHLLVGDETILLGEVEEFGAGKRMGDGDLDCLAIELLGELNGVADRFLGFAGDSKPTISNLQPASFIALRVS